MQLLSVIVQQTVETVSEANSPHIRKKQYWKLSSELFHFTILDFRIPTRSRVALHLRIAAHV